MVGSRFCSGRQCDPELMRRVSGGGARLLRNQSALGEWEAIAASEAARHGATFDKAFCLGPWGSLVIGAAALRTLIARLHLVPASAHTAPCQSSSFCYGLKWRKLSGCRVGGQVLR